MRNTDCHIKHRYKTFLLVLLLTSCSVSWQETMRYGEVLQTPFVDTVDFEIKTGLIIVPVTINDRTYRFLFDTGAPFSVSQQLQDEFKFPKVSQGNLIDSDNNKLTVNYVKVDTTWLGAVPFINQTAFVGDFNANPILECMALDGIIGSNFMHHCNWTIDMQNKQISLTNRALDSCGTKVPFKINRQYDILVPLTFNDSTLVPVKLDYGFNGALNLTNRMYDFLLDRHEIDTFIVRSGLNHGGIVGTSVELYERISPIDSIWLGGILFDDVLATSGHMSLLGTKLLSNYLVSIDWDNKYLYFDNNTNDSLSFSSFGLSVSYSQEKGMYIQSIIEGSEADKMGIEINMSVLAINDLDFVQSPDYCAFITLLDDQPLLLEMTLLTTERDTFRISLEKKDLF